MFRAKSSRKNTEQQRQKVKAKEDFTKPIIDIVVLIVLLFSSGILVLTQTLKRQMAKGKAR
jgi:hypothetical protein